MLPKNKRLDKKTLTGIMNEKRVFSSRLLLFFYKNSDKPQYSFVAPKNIFKSAVMRNKQRRIGYNILRKIDIRAGSGVFFYKKESKLAPKGEIEKDVIFILKKVKFL